MMEREDAPFSGGQVGDGISYVNNVVELLAAVQGNQDMAVQTLNGGVP